MNRFDSPHSREFIEIMDTEERIDQIYVPHVKRIVESINYQPMSILDIGSGPGITAVLLAKKYPAAMIIGIDSSKDMLDYANEKRRNLGIYNLNFELGDAQDLKFEDESFDLVLSKGVLKMIPDKIGFIKEIWRVLKPNRCAFISDLRRDKRAVFEKTAHELPERERERARGALERSLSLDEVQALLKESGFLSSSEMILSGYRIMFKMLKK
jgi:ubiquinone/menaquinone biosynthesis C-methylase UbiE